MAQLSSDLEGFGEPMRSVDEAAIHIAGTLAPVADVETVPLAEADARVIAYDLLASMALPPFTNSAVDGYAVRFADVVSAAGAPLTVADRVMAGGSAKGSVPAGRAVRIFTGAPMPDGSDTVFMQEDVRVDANGHVHFPTGLSRGANVRAVGEDISAGGVVLPKGQTSQASGRRGLCRARPYRTSGPPVGAGCCIFNRRRDCVAWIGARTLAAV
jgi:molybdopterin molybdotransferase